MISVLIIFFLTIGLLIFMMLFKPYLSFMLGNKKINIETYSVIVIIGPLLLLIFRLLSPSEMWQGLNSLGKASPIGILILFFSMVFISIYLDHVGFMEYCALLALKLAKHDGKKLFFSFYFIVSLLTIFTSNDIIILTLTPFIYYFAKHAKINPKAFLLSEFFAANTWSMMLYIGNPTNIFVASAFGIKFMEYLKMMFLPTLASGLVSLSVLYLLFKKDISVKIPLSEKSPEEALNDKTGAMIGLGVLSLCIISIAAAPYFNIQMWPLSFAFCIFMALIIIIKDIINKKHELPGVLTKMPWPIVPFLISFFILVNALDKYGISTFLASFLSSENTTYSIFVLGILSALSANLLNNIPMTVAFVSILSRLPQSILFPSSLAVIIGSNLGANITPIGALAGIMWMNILKQKDFKISFFEFIKYGSIVTFFSLLASLIVLSIEFI
jgi:arsenical pump membrane protein